MKLLILGYARHGKDSVSSLLCNRLGLRSMSSSFHAAERLMMPLLVPKYGYQTVEECFDDRVNHREEWYNAIRDYTRDDPARLAKEILSVADVYIGMRSMEEFKASVHLFDFVLWVDASRRLPPETTKSCTVGPECAHYIIDNNGNIETAIQDALNKIKTK